MKKSNLYIISGCNGAGKTTASLTLFPKILESFEFVNADEIAKELRLGDPDATDIAAGRIMLKRIDYLLKIKQNFALETTLASRSLKSIIQRAKQNGYSITLVFYWLESPDLAIKRVSLRVKEGGHFIPPEVIRRRYYSGLMNMFRLYIPICDNWMIFDNSKEQIALIAEGESDMYLNIKISSTFMKILNLYNDGQRI